MMKRAFAALAGGVLIASALAVSAGSPAAHATTSLPPPHLTALDAGRKSGAFSAAATTLHAANAYVERDWQPVPYCGTSFCQPGQTPNPYIRSSASFRVDAVPNGGTARFFANQWGAFQNGDPNGGYGGLQTDVITNGVDQGRGAIASIWGALGATPGPGVTAVSGTESGDTFWSLHLPYQWLVGDQYTVTASTDLNGHITANLVHNNAPYDSHLLGTFTVPSTWKGFGLSQAQWTEDYLAPPYATCSVIPVSRMHVFATATMTAGYPNFGYHEFRDIPYIQSGTGCTNSASIARGSQVFDLLVGATS